MVIVNFDTLDWWFRVTILEEDISGVCRDTVLWGRKSLDSFVSCSWMEVSKDIVCYIVFKIEGCLDCLNLFFKCKAVRIRTRNSFLQKVRVTQSSDHLFNIRPTKARLHVVKLDERCWLICWKYCKRDNDKWCPEVQSGNAGEHLEEQSWNETKIFCESAQQQHHELWFY